MRSWAGIKIAFAWVGFLVACRLPAMAAEQILSFAGTVTVHTDGSLTVVENLRVRAEGRQIKHGIYRDFPTRYTDPQGKNIRVGFEFQGAKRDGREENYFIQDQSNGIRIYLGRKEVFLPEGIYSYQLTYHTTRQLGYFADHDELYWNVTGNGWDFPIQQASCSVCLPDTISPDTIRGTGYTGPQGSKEQALRCEKQKSRMFYTTTRALNPHEGFTIVAAWPKGYVQPMAADEPSAGWKVLRDTQVLLIGILGLVALFAYFLLAWLIVGRDPEKGVVVPLFAPSDKLSPAAMRYVHNLGYDLKCMAAGLVSLAVKGYITIQKQAGSFILQRTDKNEDGLTQEENNLVSRLLEGGRFLKLENDNHAVISTASAELKRNLAESYLKKYFITNTLYLIPSILISGTTVTILWLRVQCFSRQAMTYDLTTVLILAVLVLMSGLTIVFHFLLKAPTRMGRKVMDRIEGFKLYLATAEAPRLDLLTPPEKTPALFEKYLPYALALNVETQWGKKFEQVLQTAAADPNATYCPGWYFGTDFSGSRFASAFGASFTRAVSSASAAPGSSSGFGGGSSGGGGGGGGGGGW